MRGKFVEHTALLLIDVLNELDFEGNEHIVEASKVLGERLRSLKRAAVKAGIPVIYLNDNLSDWHCNFDQLYDRCARNSSNGSALAQKLKPAKSDYYVLKPMHSGFYGTPLAILLAKLKIKNLVFAGIAADICVLYTANDAYMRGFKLCIVEDGVISNTAELRNGALKSMHDLLKAELRPADELIRTWTAVKSGKTRAAKFEDLSRARVASSRPGG